MHEVLVTWPRITKIWGLLVWRGFAVGFAISFVVAFVVTFIARVFGADAVTAHAIGYWTGFLASFPWGLVVVRMALRKRYRDFRLSLVEASTNST